MLAVFALLCTTAVLYICTAVISAKSGVATAVISPRLVLFLPSRQHYPAAFIHGAMRSRLPLRWARAPSRLFSTSAPASARTNTPRSYGPRNTLRKEPIPATQRGPQPQQQPQQSESASSESQQPANPNYIPSQNTLLAPVHIPEDPNAVLKETHPATSLLANSGLVVQRQLELMNVMV